MSFDHKKQVVLAYEALCLEYVEHMAGNIQEYLFNGQGESEEDADTMAGNMVGEFKDALRACKRDHNESNICRLNASVMPINNILGEMDERTLEEPFLFIDDYS